MSFVQTLRCSCETIKGQVEKWHLAVGPLAWAMPAEVVCMYGVAVQSVYVLLL